MEDCVRVIEIDSSSTLEDLHFAIQEAVQFGNDHLYEFYSARSAEARKRTRFNEENEAVFDLTLEKLYPLEKGNQLFYLFGFGDSWHFKITKSRKKTLKQEPYISYPRLR